MGMLNTKKIKKTSFLISIDNVSKKNIKKALNFCSNWLCKHNNAAKQQNNAAVVN